MMRRAAIGLVVLLAIAGGSARAYDTPRPGTLDPRIRTVRYNGDQVIQLDGYFGFQMMIEFAPDERIENVSIGDSTAWQITPNHKANLLFIKPTERGRPTNMTVVTDQRRYAFELTSRGAPRHTADIAYVVRFLYPVPPAPPVPPPPPPPRPPERKNSAYTYTGSRSPLPSLVFDDGHFTYFQWPENASTPAVFVVQPDGGESIVNYGVRDGYQVVEQVAPRWVLRNGKEVTTVINNGWREATPGAEAPRPADARTAHSAAKAEGHP